MSTPAAATAPSEATTRSRWRESLAAAAEKSAKLIGDFAARKAQAGTRW